jgi:1,4-alpha-glucan branching enzyme
MLSAVAAAVIVIGGGVAVTALPELLARPGASAPVQLVATDQKSGLHVEMLYGRSESGTWTNLQLSDVPSGMRCKLVVVDRNGQRHEASDWWSAESGTKHVRTDLRMRPEQIERFEVVDHGHNTLVSLKEA